MGGGACHEALQHDAHLSEADKGVEVTNTRGGSITCAAEHQALDPRHLRNGLHRDDGGSRSSFLPPRRVRAPPASSVLLPTRHCSSRTWLRRYDLLAAARGSAPPGPNFLRRCPAPTALNRRDNLNSIRRIGHRHGCMPLAKSRPGPVGSGAVSSRSPNSADRGQAFKRLAHYLICIKSDLVPRVWRACHYSAISLIRPFFCALLTYSSLTNY